MTDDDQARWGTPGNAPVVRATASTDDVNPWRLRKAEEGDGHMEKPSVGRIVHYVAYGTPGGEFPAGVCRAAIVTELSTAIQGDPMAIGICVVNPSGLFFNRDIRYSDDKTAGTWHWPERV